MIKKLPKLKKLNAKGVSHQVLIAVLVISGIAGFGAWRVYASGASGIGGGTGTVGDALNRACNAKFTKNTAKKRWDVEFTTTRQTSTQIGFELQYGQSRYIYKGSGWITPNVGSKTTKNLTISMDDTKGKKFYAVMRIAQSGTPTKACGSKDF